MSCDTKKNNDGFQSEFLSLEKIKPSPENDTLYRPINSDDPEIIELSKSIRKHGLREPLVISRDYYILSGHRRYAACKLAGLTKVWVRIENICRSDDINHFTVLLRECNRQRDKTNAEKLREELVTIDPEEAYSSLIEYRLESSRISTRTIPLREVKTRKRISKAKQPFLKCVTKIIWSLRNYWPLSERSIHYNVLNAPPLRHSSKPKSTYKNDRASYKDLTDLCTRARLTGDIPFEAIGDKTRPVTVWKCHNDTRSFLRHELNGMLKGYFRNLMVSQPNHIEVLVEKNTVENFIKETAGKYCLPITSGRGFSSLPPRKAMADRFEKSGKARLILIILSDFDPSGEEIAHSFARSMRDDFGIETIEPIKAALNYEQIKAMDLNTDAFAKTGDPNYKRFVEKYGTDVYELEAVSPSDLQSMLSKVIDSVIDVDAFNTELEAEKLDATFLQGVRNQVTDAVSRVID